MTICIIPARQGSKRLKNKNILNFFGKPMIYYPIKAAIRSKLFSNVFVSTDSMKIKALSEKYGANVLKLRAKHLSDDKTNVKDVLKDFLVNNNFKNEKYVCCIYPTSVLINPNIIRKAYSKFKKDNSNMLISLCPFSNPPDRAFEIKKNNVRLTNIENQNKRSQDLKKKYFDTGTLYFFKLKHFLKKNELFPKKMSYFLLNELNSQDINTKQDMELAKIKYKLKSNV